MPIVLLNGTVWKNWHPSSHGQPNRAIAPLLSTSYREPYFSNDCCYWYKWFVPVTGIIGVIRIVSQHVVGAFGYRHVDSVMHDHIPTNRYRSDEKEAKDGMSAEDAAYERKVRIGNTLRALFPILAFVLFGVLIMLLQGGRF